MMAQSEHEFDVVIIGAGHNGLAAAATLAKSGKRVCVLERASEIGGMARNYEIAPGVIAPHIAHLLYNFNRTVAKELGIAEKVETQTVSTIALSPGGKHIEIADGALRYADGTAHPNAAAYLEIRRKAEKFGQLLAPLALRSPPDLSQGLSLAGAGEAAAIAKLGLRLKMFGKKDMREFLRIVLSNIYDLALDEMPDGEIAGLLAADAVWGAWAGPRSPGTVFSLMYRYAYGADPLLPKGGAGAVVDMLVEAASTRGVETRTGVGVTNVKIEDDTVTGVILEDGSEISARAVMSSIGAFASMQLAGTEHFDIEAVRRLRNIRAKGMTAKVNMVLASAPAINGLSADQMSGRFVIAPSANYVERAFNKAKYGEMATAPVIEFILSPIVNASAEGAYILSAIVQYIPYHLKGGWDEASRKQLTEIMVETLSRYIPDLRENIRHTNALSPADIERETGTPGGHWHHGEMSTDQLLTVRPVNGMSRYAFGVKGYYLCGAGAHPGGGVSGAAGRNSALQLLKDGVLA